MMRHVVIAALTTVMLPLFCASVAHATAQELDLVVIDGKKFYFVETPMTDFWIKTKQTPKFEPLMSSNWKGYTATWEIRDRKLFLTSFTARVKGEAFDVEKMLGAPLPVEAKWLSGPLHAVDNVKFVSVRRYSENARRLYFLDGVLKKESKVDRVECCNGLVGISLGKRGNHLVVERIHTGSPAAKSSQLEQGDIVEAFTDLDGEVVSLKEMDAHRAHQLIRGLVSQELSIHVRRPDALKSSVVKLHRVLWFEGEDDWLKEVMRKTGK